MDDNWDLFAVVRANLKAKRVTNPTAAVNDPLPSFPSDLPPIYGEQNSYGFPALGDEMNNPYLQEIYYGFRYGNQAPPNPNPNPNPTAVVDDPVFFVQPRQDFMQENVQFVSPAIDSPPRNLSAATTLQRTKKGRRKNYQPKLIRQMTKEEVHTDLWSWRKYGQKPIKGVLNPRSYYKCSTSKGCAARKQVELFTENPETYVVTYAGEHTHPRPTRRSSLSGSTRTRFANPARAKNGGRTKKGSSSSSSSTAPAPPPAAGGIFSPDTPSTESEATEFFNDLSDLYDGAAEENEENIDMLVNDLLNDEDDDFFIGFDDSDDFSGGDDFFPSDFLASPQWNFDGGEFDGNGGF